MAKVSEITKPYFSHDESASQDGKILNMFRDFRRQAKDMSQEELESFVALGAYGIFWRIVEFMHGNNLLVKDIDALADDLRIDTRFVEQILNNYNLFHIEDDYYVSDRILKNLNKQQSKSEKNKKSAETRWLLSDFDKTYADIFGSKPVLSSDEIESLKKYSLQISDLREKLPDLIYTLKKLKFDTDTNFVPTANWLLKGNNLLRLYNGEFGRLRHKKTETETKQEEAHAKQEQIEREEKNTDFQNKINSIINKSDAIALVAENTLFATDKTVIYPNVKPLCQKFDITIQDLKEYNNAKEKI